MRKDHPNCWTCWSAVMSDPTAADRARRYRERKAGRLPPAQRQSLTVEGRADRAARVAKVRAKRKRDEV
jgi:hypothetical protein